MTLLIDPPLLVAAGAVVERLVDDERWRRRLRVGVTAAAAATGVAYYTNARWTRPTWRLLSIESGRDWMLNTWLFDFEHERPDPIVHVAAGVAFLAYPAWTLLGRRLGRREGHRR